MARPGRLELPTLCLEGILGFFAFDWRELQVIVNTVQSDSGSKPMQPHLNRYPLHYPLQFPRRGERQSRLYGLNLLLVFQIRNGIEYTILAWVNITGAHLNRAVSSYACKGPNVAARFAQACEKRVP